MYFRSAYRYFKNSVSKITLLCPPVMFKMLTFEEKKPQDLILEHEDFSIECSGYKIVNLLEDTKAIWEKLFLKINGSKNLETTLLFLPWLDSFSHIDLPCEIFSGKKILYIKHFISTWICLKSDE